MEFWELIFVLAAIIGIVAWLVKYNNESGSGSSTSTSSSPTMRSTMSTSATTFKSKPTQRADEQCYYQYAVPTPAPCAFCGCENATGSATCQVCGKSL